MAATILIVDDNAQLRALLRGIAAQESDLHVVGEAEDGGRFDWPRNSSQTSCCWTLWGTILPWRHTIPS
jgi:DNA-binding NarL/FixJ family response regulator